MGRKMTLSLHVVKTLFFSARKTQRTNMVELLSLNKISIILNSLS